VREKVFSARKIERQDRIEEFAEPSVNGKTFSAGKVKRKDGILLFMPLQPNRRKIFTSGSAYLPGYSIYKNES
jgi:hypothetical protein